MPMNPPALVFLHGLFGRSSDFDSVRALLPSRFPSYAVDMPIATGHGDLTTLDALQSFLVRRLEAIPNDALVLAGSSLGGLLALRHAMAHPERVLGLVLSGSSGLEEPGFPRSLPRRITRAWIATTLRTVYADPSFVSESQINEVESVLANPARRRSLVALSREVKRTTLRESLRLVRARTLLLWGLEDRLTPPSVAREMYALLPNARLLFVAGAGHAPMLERPSTFALHTAAFLRDLSGLEPIEEEEAA